MIDQELYVVWRYDLFPYYIVGKMIELEDSGRVSVEGYPGKIFKPVLITDEKHGIEIKEALGKLKNEYKIESGKLHNAYVEKVNDVINRNGLLFFIE